MSNRKAIPKKVREQVYQKYNGHCAYCGCEISYKEMQVDHIKSVYSTEEKPCDEDVNDIGNLMPSCRMCNFYKSTFTIEGFRTQLGKIPERLNKLFIFKLACKYGLVEPKRKEIKFYFEDFKDYE